MAEQQLTIQAVFLNVEMTLGVTDRPGSFLPYRPSSLLLLETFKRLGWRIGAIVNLAAGVKQTDYVQVVRNGILSEDPRTGKIITIGDFLTAEDFTFSQDAGGEKS